MIIARTFPRLAISDRKYLAYNYISQQVSQASGAENVAKDTPGVQGNIGTHDQPLVA